MKEKVKAVIKPRSSESISVRYDIIVAHRLGK